MRLAFAAVALFFLVSNVRSLAAQPFAAPARAVPLLKAAWGPASGAERAAERAAQRAWVRRGPGRSLAMARSLAAVVNRANAETASAASEWAFDEGDDEGRVSGGAGDELVDVFWLDRRPEAPPPPPALAPWGRPEAPGAPREPFCPPIQRPPIG
ncbi:MAG TPA: hypothetical protein VFS43_46680 [Polyangiaceae bacterium]|nr:hypothetical protein [Polyangiaceae bacterium]